MRFSKQGMKKSPSSGKGKASRPPGVVPITNFFSKSPKSNSSLAAKVLDSGRNTTQLSLSTSPIKDLPKLPPLDNSSNSHGANGFSETTTSEGFHQTSVQPSKISPKKIKVGEVRLVLNKSPLKYKKETKTGSQVDDNTEHLHQVVTQTTQSSVIVISDSPAEFNDSLIVDVEFIRPSPKRQCLIDLTESPIVVVDTGLKCDIQVKEPDVHGESSLAGNQGKVGTSGISQTADNILQDTEQSVNEPATTSNYSVKKALFTDCNVHSNDADIIPSNTAPEEHSDTSAVDATAQDHGHNEMNKGDCSPTLMSSKLSSTQPTSLNPEKRETSNNKPSNKAHDNSNTSDLQLPINKCAVQPAVSFSSERICSPTSISGEAGGCMRPLNSTHVSTSLSDCPDMDCNDAPHQCVAGSPAVSN